MLFNEMRVKTLSKFARQSARITIICACTLASNGIRENEE